MSVRSHQKGSAPTPGGTAIKQERNDAYYVINTSGPFLKTEAGCAGLRKTQKAGEANAMPSNGAYSGGASSMEAHASSSPA